MTSRGRRRARGGVVIVTEKQAVWNRITAVIGSVGVGPERVERVVSVA